MMSKLLHPTSDKSQTWGVITLDEILQRLAMYSKQQQAAYAMAGGIAQEVFSSIKTVTAYGAQQMEYKR